MIPENLTNAPTIDHGDPILSLARILGVEEAIYSGRVLSIRIDRRLNMSATLKAGNAVQFCFELGSVVELDEATFLGIMGEVAHWPHTTSPASLEVYETELLLVWTPPITDGPAVIQDLRHLMETCLGIQTFIHQRRKDASTPYDALTWREPRSAPAIPNTNRFRWAGTQEPTRNR